MQDGPGRTAAGHDTLTAQLGRPPGHVFQPMAGQRSVRQADPVVGHTQSDRLSVGNHHHVDPGRPGMASDIRQRLPQNRDELRQHRLGQRRLNRPPKRNPGRIAQQPGRFGRQTPNPLTHIQAGRRTVD